MAASVARHVQAKVLMLNHISASNKEADLEAKIVAEAETVLAKYKTRVQLTYDFLDFLVPRKGFPATWDNQQLSQQKEPNTSSDVPDRAVSKSENVDAGKDWIPTNQIAVYHVDLKVVWIFGFF